MLCDLIKNENELYGYSAIAMNEIKQREPGLIEAYLKAFESAKHEMILVNQPEVLSLYSQAVRLVKQNRYDEFINYFSRNFGELLMQISQKRGSEEIKKHAEAMMEISSRFKKSDLIDMKWGVA
jgi:hypothetical protein